MSANNPALLAALRRALEADPHNGGLWSHFGDMLADAGDHEEAAGAYRRAVASSGEEGALVLKLVASLRRCNYLAEALIRAEGALAKEPNAALRAELARVLLARGELDGAREQYLAAVSQDPTLADEAFAAALHGAVAGSAESALLRAGEPDDGPTADDLLAEFGVRDAMPRFDDVVGLDDVKDQINLRIIAPFKRRDVFKAFKRQAGGGLLLYGPPGCGKTFIARATAGECDATFLAVTIHELVDKYYGESEKLVHDLFERARLAAPSVLFFDEFDALGTSRGRSGSQFWRTLVNQLLTEMDGLGGRSDGVLVFAATNLPWNVDVAFRRPGRFDRALFVPPPDAVGRELLLRRLLADVPGGGAIDAARLAGRTDLLTGADLIALVERASERALAASLRGDVVHPVTESDLDVALGRTPSSAAEWFISARNHARYANDGRQYDDLIEYLKQIKKW